MGLSSPADRLNSYPGSLLPCWVLIGVSAVYLLMGGFGLVGAFFLMVLLTVALPLGLGVVSLLRGSTRDWRWHAGSLTVAWVIAGAFVVLGNAAFTDRALDWSFISLPMMIAAVILMVIITWVRAAALVRPRRR